MIWNAGMDFKWVKQNYAVECKKGGRRGDPL